MQLAVIRSLENSEGKDDMGESDTVGEFAELLATLPLADEVKSAALRGLEARPRLHPSRVPDLALPASVGDDPLVPCVKEDSFLEVVHREGKKKCGELAQVRTDELGPNPGERRDAIRSSLEHGFYVCYSRKKSTRTLHKLGATPFVKQKRTQELEIQADSDDPAENESAPDVEGGLPSSEAPVPSSSYPTCEMYH